MRNRRSLRWLIVAIAASALEADAVKGSKKDATLSYATREVFQTETKSGRLAFMLAWAALTAWFIPHILNGSNGE